MALSDEQIDEIAGPADYFDRRVFAREIESEVRMQDDALILQLVEALENFDDAGPVGEGWQSDELVALLKSARARLDDKP